MDKKGINDMESTTEAAAWLQTLDDKAFDLLHPRARDVSLNVIATVLSRIPRFGGHAREPYTVAEHSLHVAHCVRERDPTLVLPALLHDAHEAYSGFGDVCRPAKELAPIIKQIEGVIDMAIAAHFGFGVELFYHPDVKLADDRVLAAEKRDLMGPEPRPWAELPEPVEWNVWEPYENHRGYLPAIFKNWVSMARGGHFE